MPPHASVEDTHSKDLVQFESVWDQFPGANRVSDVFRFFSSRKALLEREPLYNLPKSELKKRGLLGPWAFNAVESTLAGLPGMLVGALSFLFLKAPSAPLSVRINSAVMSILHPFTIPFSLMLITYVIAYSVLPAIYSKHENILGAQRKYLYLDGAMGLWPQLIMATSLSLARIPHTAFPSDPAFGAFILFCSVTFIVGFTWQWYLTLKVIRLDLFDYDYLVEKPDTMFLPITEPWGKYMVVSTFILPLLFWALVQAVIWVASVVAALVIRAV
jgi:hypothetical protein